MRLRLLIVVTVLSSALAICQGTAPAATANCSAGATSGAQGFDDRNPRYQIESGDTFDVNFEFAPEFNQTITVQPDGFITLREVGDVHVSGQTVPQLTQTLCDSYSKIMVTPSIAVVLKDFEKPYFVAGGQVLHPGKYTLRGDTTLTEAIAMAGGFTDRSKHSQVLLFRRVSDQWSEAKVIDVKKMMSAKNLHEDPFLKPGDMIVVPQNRISKIARFLPTSGVNTYVNPAQY
ncbi:MAG TPA: polysaccharide biosynthesis/export family protein [Verrucomicrobiae bacterium]|nr:polysaccharide biosynthesis/export family protein [Verrucomicrobiae bacterium]